MSVYLSVCQFVCLCLSVCAHSYVYMSIYLCFSLSICLSVCVCLYVSVCVCKIILHVFGWRESGECVCFCVRVCVSAYVFCTSVCLKEREWGNILLCWWWGMIKGPLSTQIDTTWNRLGLKNVNNKLFKDFKTNIKIKIKIKIHLQNFRFLLNNQDTINSQIHT